MKLNFINSAYPDFLYRLEDFLKLIPDGQGKCTKNDLIFLYSVIYSKKPMRVLEIGRDVGTSTLAICGALTDNNKGHLYSVDIVNILPDAVAEIVSEKLTILTMSSKYLLDTFDDRFDIIFIDGDHSYQMVKSDLQQSLELASNDAIILCHDADLIDVQLAINELCTRLPNTVVDCGMFGTCTQMIKVLKT
jgi:predicted O-methyltransferase YrrM